MNLFDIVISKALAGGGGDGGSSDFNKAIVTVTNNHNDAIFQIRPIKLNGDVIGFRFGEEGGIETEDAFYYDYGTSVTDTFYIYHDCSMIAYSETLASVDSYTVTGDAEVTTMAGPPFPVVMIYGDCTITIS